MFYLLINLRMCGEEIGCKQFSVVLAVQHSSAFLSLNYHQCFSVFERNACRMSLQLFCKTTN